ncbi:hypothetical protein [Cellulomonas endophytica]|uniref:hypothetical protein n=1 Tax=Cellulomonas endophytica TaxID=2494735 RepID=UPI001012B59E|nr:hypothetical protein [Cellulomonas endophytica]
MRVPVLPLDASTTRRSAGNPAAVVLLDRVPDEALLGAVAADGPPRPRPVPGGTDRPRHAPRVPGVGPRELDCRLVGDRVELIGSCVPCLEGHVEI